MLSEKDIKELQVKYGVAITYNEKDNNFTDDSYCNYNHYTVWGKNKMKTVKLPKKEIDKKWLAEKIENYLNATSKNLRAEFQKLDIKGSIYYTSFGLSYDCWFKSDSVFDKEIQTIKDKLNSLKIKFSNEFSDARWVYRFKISQSKENLELIKGLKA